jgi:DNA invertase Pin-like site-specific DNA recombinase
VIDRFARERRGARSLCHVNDLESGWNSDRPEPAKALHLKRVTGATLVTAKLDRLGRNAAFRLALKVSCVRFLASCIPRANDPTVGTVVMVAEA